jgi:hypothetical protein
MYEPSMKDLYLATVRNYLRAYRVSGRRQKRALAEFDDHLTEAIAEGQSRGLAQHEAESEALARFGSPKEVARRYALDAGGGLRIVLVEARDGRPVIHWWSAAKLAFALAVIHGTLLDLIAAATTGHWRPASFWWLIGTAQGILIKSYFDIRNESRITD